jgi:hypothetical protein
MIAKAKRNEIMELIGHLCVGLSVLMKGIDKLEHPGKEFIAVVLIIVGLAVIAFSVVHKKYEKRLGHIRPYILATEGIVMAFVGYSYMTDGSHTVHYAYFFTSVLFFWASYFCFRRKTAKKGANS